VFGIVVDAIAANEEVLVCDDLTDEWADFIGISAAGQPKTISFYHAKHGALSLGASPFHIAVSQAMKNLGRMALSEEALPAKLDRWEQTYANNVVITQIGRIIRGTRPVLEQKIAEVRGAPDTIRRAYIVTSSLSRRQLEAEFAAITRGQAPRPHFVQLYWLLNAFFSACVEAGAVGYVICQD
jgi:hypothetical protein